MTLRPQIHALYIRLLFIDLLPNDAFKWMENLSLRCRRPVVLEGPQPEARDIWSLINK